MIRAAKRHRTASAVTATLILAALAATSLFLVLSQQQNAELLAINQLVVTQRDRADVNLKSLQSLVVTLIDTSELELPNIRELFPVRLKLTNAAASVLNSCIWITQHLKICADNTLTSCECSAISIA